MCGIQATLDTAIAATRSGGTVFNVAIHEKALSLNLNSITLSEKKLMGGLCYTKEDFEAVVQVLSEKGVEAERLITSVVALEDVVRGGFKELIENTAVHVKILVQAN
jgi:(R,R)-butanediol dehydrogenase/meso-butanediol dehydrogenase/diacetyl reductase